MCWSQIFETINGRVLHAFPEPCSEFPPRCGAVDDRGSGKLRLLEGQGLDVAEPLEWITHYLHKESTVLKVWPTRGTKRVYRGTSLIRSTPPPYDHHRAICIVLL